MDPATTVHELKANDARFTAGEITQEQHRATDTGIRQALREWRRASGSRCSIDPRHER